MELERQDWVGSDIVIEKELGVCLAYASVGRWRGFVRHLDNLIQLSAKGSERAVVETTMVS
jgi:hypothetical protein